MSMSLLQWGGGFSAGCLLTAQALACGACAEDKVAATYDHAVIKSAAAQKKYVVFCDVQGQVSVERLRQAAGQVKGVDPSSIRTSADPAALSFALDANVSLPEAAVARMSTLLEPQAKLVVLKTVAASPP
jgi:hypothetical protein